MGWVDVDLPFLRPLPPVEMASEQHTPRRSPALGTALAYQKQTQNLLEYRCMRREILGENSVLSGDVAASSPAGVTVNSGTDDTAHTATDVDSVQDTYELSVSSTKPGINFPPLALDWAPTPVNMKKWYRRDNATGKLLVYEGTHPDQQSKVISASLSPSSPAMLSSLGSIAGVENTFPPKPYHSPPLGTGEFIDDQCWACELCTYVNHNGSAVACEICLNPRGMPKCDLTPPGSKPRRVLSLNVVSALRRSWKSRPQISVENENRENDQNAGNLMYGKSNEGCFRQSFDKKKSKRPGASSSSSSASILLFQRLRRRYRVRPEKALYEIPQGQKLKIRSI